MAKTILNEKNVAHVDIDTGEIICETYGCTEIQDNTLTENEMKKKEYLEKYELKFNNGVRFVKLYDDVLDALAENLTLAEFKFFMKLTHHVAYDDCILKTNGHGNGKILDAKDISEYLNENYKTCCRLLSSLIKKGVLGKFSTGSLLEQKVDIKCYICNPYIVCRGNKVNRTVLSYFINSGWDKLYSETENY